MSPANHKNPGFAAIEYIITAPILLLLLLAITDIGRMLYQYNTLTKLAQQGARFYAGRAFLGNSRVPDTQAANDTTMMIEEALNETGIMQAPSDILVETDIISTVYARVTIHYGYTFSEGFINIQRYFGEDIVHPLQLRASAVIRILQ